MKRIIFDFDDTLTTGGTLPGAEPNIELIEKLKEYKALGFDIIISTSRSVRTFNGNIGKINKETLPKLIVWLEKNNIPFDEIYVGKPWCGKEGFYVDDKSIRPTEFVNLSYKQIKKIID